MKLLSWLLRILIISSVGFWIYQIMAGSLGAEPAKELNKQTGFTALIFLVINLWIGCLMWLHSQRGWKLSSAVRLIITQRRFLGITTFIFLCAHILLYFVLEGFEAKAFTQIISKTYLNFGIIAFLGMLVLTITSNDFSVRKLGGKKWKQLHRIVYVVFFLVMGHIFLIEKADLVLFAQVTLPLFALLITRGIFALIRKFKSKNSGTITKNSQ